MTTTYAIRGGEEGARRLDLLAHALEPTTDAFLAWRRDHAGMTCLDIGCGAGHVSRPSPPWSDRPARSLGWISTR